MMMKANPAETLEQFKQDFPVILPIRVAWGEMDAFQHVNNVSYIRYFESARIAYMEAMGMEANIKTSPVGPILGDIYCRYRRPVTYPDTLNLSISHATDIKKDRDVVLEHQGANKYTAQADIDPLKAKYYLQVSNEGNDDWRMQDVAKLPRAEVSFDPLPVFEKTS